MKNAYAAFLLGSALVTYSATAEVDLEPVIKKGVVSPVHAMVAPGEPTRLYIVEQRGKILILENGKLETFLDMQKQVTSGGEMGLLSLAFHPKYASNGRYYLNYTTDKGSPLQTVIAERRKGETTEKQLLRINQPYSNHNGGLNAFGPDGFLYIGMGDGGSGGDPQNNSQNMKSLLGKMLRIDVDKAQGDLPYAIPTDNPFQTATARAEIYALGLRNPWRFSFDRKTGALFTGDVGQNILEEIDIVEKGGNYGWRVMEASRCFIPETNCPTKGLIVPIFEYPRNQGVSITGGYVYRGKAIPELQGAYVYADYQSGKIWALSYDQEKKKTVGNKLLLSTQMLISSFAEDADGEILVIDHRGPIYRLVKAE